MSAWAVDLTAWGELLGAYIYATTAIDAAFGKGSPDLMALSAALQRRLDSLRRRLPPGRDGALAPLAFLLDEKVLGRLPTGDRELAWPLLGSAIADSSFGGDLFFSLADDVCREASPPALVVQVFLFCLDEGFVGRYADDADALADCRKQLFARLAPIAPPGPPMTHPRPLVAPRPLWHFVAGGVGAVVSSLLAMEIVVSRL